MTQSQVEPREVSYMEHGKWADPWRLGDGTCGTSHVFLIV